MTCTMLAQSDECFVEMTRPEMKLFDRFLKTKSGLEERVSSRLQRRSCRDLICRALTRRWVSIKSRQPIASRKYPFENFSGQDLQSHRRHGTGQTRAFDSKSRRDKDQIDSLNLVHCLTWRRVSSLLRQFLNQFSESATSFTG